MENFNGSKGEREGILAGGLVGWLESDRDIRKRLEWVREGAELSPAVEIEGEMEKCIGENENAAEGIRTRTNAISEIQENLGGYVEAVISAFRDDSFYAEGSFPEITDMDMKSEEEGLEEALGEISGSNSQAWTALLRLKKAALIDRLLEYKGLQLATLGLQLWHRRASDNSLQGGIQTNPLVLDNVEVMRKKLQHWCQTDLAGFAYECEVAISCAAVEGWLREVRYSLPVTIGDKLASNQTYREEITRAIKKELDNSKAGGVLLMLVRY